jgi:hypothetical protein
MTGDGGPEETHQARIGVPICNSNLIFIQAVLTSAFRSLYRTSGNGASNFFSTLSPLGHIFAVPFSSFQAFTGVQEPTRPDMYHPQVLEPLDQLGRRLAVD